MDDSIEMWNEPNERAAFAVKFLEIDDFWETATFVIGFNGWKI